MLGNHLNTPAGYAAVVFLLALVLACVIASFAVSMLLQLSKRTQDRLVEEARRNGELRQRLKELGQNESVEGDKASMQEA